MANRTEIITKTHECGNIIQIEKNWEAGGVNDYGGWVLQCSKCGAMWAYALGRDVNASSIISGAEEIDRWDDEVADDKAETLAKYGIEVDESS